MRFQQVPNHPYASYAIQPLADGSAFLHFACSRCQDRSQKRCMAPRQRGNRWIMHYAQMHSHGLRPVVTR